MGASVGRPQCACACVCAGTARYAPNPSIENPLFFDPKPAMLFGDAEASSVAVTDELNALGMPAAGDTVGAAQASS